jgi:hypothetical protein
MAAQLVVVVQVQFSPDALHGINVLNTGSVPNYD